MAAIPIQRGWFAFGLCLLMGTAPVGAQVVDAARQSLKNDSLAVELMVPNHPQRYNRGTRFTPVAAILSAQTGGQQFLYNPVDHDPIEDHGGLAAEFDLVTPLDPDDLMPPGYHEAAAGEGFLKVGVGVLKKQAQRYSLFQQSELIEPALTSVHWTKNSAQFYQRCTGVRGYAYELGAAVVLQNNTIVVDWTLQNTGSKMLTTRQYTHNFFRFGPAEISSGYALRFPFDFTASGLLPEQQQAGREIRFVKPIPTWTNLMIPFPEGYCGPNVCELAYQPSGARVVCETSMAGLFTAVHARRSYIAPEQFILLSIAPGQRVTWQRTYQFFAPGAP